MISIHWHGSLLEISFHRPRFSLPDISIYRPRSLPETSIHWPRSLPKIPIHNDPNLYLRFPSSDTDPYLRFAPTDFDPSICFHWPNISRWYPPTSWHPHGGTFWLNLMFIITKTKRDVYKMKNPPVIFSWQPGPGLPTYPSLFSSSSLASQHTMMLSSLLP